MALKFYKVLQGLSGLFKNDSRVMLSGAKPSNTTIDNLTDAAANAGVSKDSIVITQATTDDTVLYGGKFLPGTNVMLANGQTFVDASNIVLGVYTKLASNGDLLFCAPVGSFLETDVVLFARIANLTTGNGIVIPDAGTLKGNDMYENYTLRLKDMEDADSRQNDVRIYKVCCFKKTSEGEEIDNSESLSDYMRGLGLDLKIIAFSVYRNGVQITDWFQWAWNDKLVRSKGLYLPGIKEILYKDLVNLRDSNKLVPGRYYKIIDYYPTVSISTMTDGYYTLQDRGYLKTGDEEKKDNVMVSPYWQIIVQALTKNTLDENAIAFNGGVKGDFLICLIKYRLKPNYTVDLAVGYIGLIKECTYNSHTYKRSLTWNATSFFEYTHTAADGSSTMTGYTNVYEWDGWKSTSSDPRFLCLYLPVGEQTTVYGASDADTNAKPIPITVSGNVTFTYVTQESTGWIYWMKDLYNNEASYDFKNLLFCYVKRLSKYSNIAPQEMLQGCMMGNLQLVITSGTANTKYWTFHDVNATDGWVGDLSSTGNCNNNVIKTKLPSLNVIIASSIENCQILESSTNNTIETTSKATHVILDRAESSYVNAGSDIAHLRLLGHDFTLCSANDISYVDLSGYNFTVFTPSLIKQVTSNSYYSGNIKLFGGSFLMLTFTGLCSNIKIIGAGFLGAVGAYLGGYFMYGNFNNTSNVTIKTMLTDFHRFTFMPGSYNATFVADANVDKTESGTTSVGSDKGSYTFLGGSYGSGTTTSVWGWATEKQLERANSINLLYAPTTSKFTLL